MTSNPRDDDGENAKRVPRPNIARLKGEAIRKANEAAAAGNYEQRGNPSPLVRFFLDPDDIDGSWEALQQIIRDHSEQK